MSGERPANVRRTTLEGASAEKYTKEPDRHQARQFYPYR